MMGSTNEVDGNSNRDFSNVPGLMTAIYFVRQREGMVWKSILVEIRPEACNRIV